jgi:hypothetical protein
VKQKVLQSFTTVNPDAKSLEPVPSTGPGGPQKSQSTS